VVTNYFYISADLQPIEYENHTIFVLQLIRAEHGLMKLRFVVDSSFTYLLQLKHDGRNSSFCSSMRIKTGSNADEIAIAVIDHEDKTIRSRPKAVLADLQLIEHDGHTLSAVIERENHTIFCVLQLICS
jgi:hypothetical protein